METETSIQPFLFSTALYAFGEQSQGEVHYSKDVSSEGGRIHFYAQYAVGSKVEEASSCAESLTNAEGTHAIRLLAI